MPAELDRDITVTDPVVEGGVYKHKTTGETGTILGVMYDGRTDKHHGNLYTYRRGSLPQEVVENSASMIPWELTHSPSANSAGKLASAHRKKFA
jgi:hypothetical protein